MIKFIRKYMWCKKLGFNKPFRAALDKNFIFEGNFLK